MKQKLGPLWDASCLYTWEHLPYIAVLKSVHRTATVCSSIRTFFRGSKLLTVTVLWTLAKTANRGSSMDTFRSFQKVLFYDRISTTPKSVHKTATVCSFVSCKILTVRQYVRKVSIKLPRFAVVWTLCT